MQHTRSKGVRASAIRRYERQLQSVGCDGGRGVAIDRDDNVTSVGRPSPYFQTAMFSGSEQFLGAGAVYIDAPQMGVHGNAKTVSIRTPRDVTDASGFRTAQHDPLLLSVSVERWNTQAIRISNCQLISNRHPQPAP